MIKTFFAFLIVLGFSFPVFAGSEQLREDIDRSIEKNEETLKQDNEPEQEQLIIQQQEILKTIDEVEMFKSLEDARKALQQMERHQRYVK